MAFAERILAPLAHIRSKLRDPFSGMAQDGVLQTAAKPKVKRIQMATALENALTIPCPDPTAEERVRDTHQMRGLRMARQEDWERLSNAILKADLARAKTPGGMPISELLAFGARADVVGAAEHALLTGRPERDAPLLAGIEALEEVLAERDTDPVIAAIVAKAHMDIGWAWRGTGWDIEVPTRNREAFAAHFDRAADIVAALDVNHIALSLLASARCALSAGKGGPVRNMIAFYEAWIDIDPRDPRALRAMGGHLLPRWHGDHDRLELEARRAAGRTHDIWGAGAYTWVMFDAISADVEACARLDLDFFLDGLQDILRRSPDQYTVNLLAAYCVNTMGATPTGHDQADYIRAQIAAAASWIVKDHLTELHPMLWAHAARGFDNALKVRCPDRFAASGYADALRYLTDLFRRELAAGNRIVFTDKGAMTRAA
jgi:hypothetical protein